MCTHATKLYKFTLEIERKEGVQQLTCDPTRYSELERSEQISITASQLNKADPTVDLSVRNFIRQKLKDNPNWRYEKITKIPIRYLKMA